LVALVEEAWCGRLIETARGRDGDKSVRLLTRVARCGLDNEMAKVRSVIPMNYGYEPWSYELYYRTTNDQRLTTNNGQRTTDNGRREAAILVICKAFHFSYVSFEHSALNFFHWFYSLK
jgi:hypothetical protein